MLGFLGDLLLAPFKCFLPTQSDDESASMPNTMSEPIADDETTNNIDVRRDSAAEEEDGGWPPKKHKEPFVAQMSEYWDQRIMDELAEQRQVQIRPPKSRAPAAPVIYCRNSIEV